MSTRTRSSSFGANPKPKIHRPSRAESAAALALDVRCACQFYETESLLPERVNPVGYNLSGDFEPCIHLRARMKEQSELESEIEAATLPHPVTIPTNHIQQFAPPSTATDSMAHNQVTHHPPINNVENMPLPSPVLSNRSISCNNMGSEIQSQQPSFMKQRDPSMSSLLRKRMSEERGLASFDKRMSQSTTSRDRFIAQKDLSQSTILRNKSLHRSGSQSLGRQESIGRYSSERTIQVPFRQERIANERTFYHDSNAHLETSGAEIPSPLSMQSGGNRRFIMTSNENLSPNTNNKQYDIDMDEVNRMDVVEKPINEKVDELPAKLESYQSNQNVCDEYKAQALLTKAKADDKPMPFSNLTPIEINPKESKETGKTISSVMPGLAFLQLMNVEEMTAVDTNAQAKPKVQYLAKFDSTLHPKEAEITEYSNSKLFDNYTSVERLHTSTSANVSTQDLHLSHAKQRDPSQSPFTRNRYNTSQNRIVVRPSEENLLQSLVSTPSPIDPYQTNQSQFIRQKDPNISAVLNRRRRNLSQIVVGSDPMHAADESDPNVKMKTSMQFDKGLVRAESERQMNYGGTDVRITKGVSFEMDRMPPIEHTTKEQHSVRLTQMPNRDREYETVANVLPVNAAHQPDIEQQAEVSEPVYHQMKDTHTSDDIHVTTEPAQSATIDSHSEILLAVAINVVDSDEYAGNEPSPPQQECSKKVTFFTSASAHTRNLQKKISTQATSLGTKFRRGLKSVNSHGQKLSSLSLKPTFRSAQRGSQPSPKERKKFKEIGFANKLKTIHLPKMPKAELPKFRLPERFRTAQSSKPSENTTTITTEPSVSAIEKTDETDMDTIVLNSGEATEPKVATTGRFDISYPKIFNRFKSQRKTEDVFSGNVEGSEYEAAIHRPSLSSFSSHFATVPRAASRIKKSIKSKLSKTRNRSGTIGFQHGSSSIMHEQMRPSDLDDHRMQMTSKTSMEDAEDGPLEILQTKEQIELASYDEENRAIHEISRAREHEFKQRKPLVHQESDLMSEESNREMDWDECERMRNKILGPAIKTPQYDVHVDEIDDMKRSTRYGRRRRNDSNYSAEETQSSGSSGVRRRTGVIEDIDDDEFFLRERGVSQDNADISEYISSAIRAQNRPYSGYSDDYYDKSNEDFHDPYRYERAPAKAFRIHSNGINRSYESYDPQNIRHESDDEIPPVAIQYFQEDEQMSFYDNDYHYYDTEGMQRYGSENEHADDYHDQSGMPIVPKRRHRSTVERDLLEHKQHDAVFHDSEPMLSNKRGGIDDFEDDPTMIGKYTPLNSRYSLDIDESNGYATIKEKTYEPAAPARRRKRSTKSLEPTSKSNTIKQHFMDSPYPDRPVRTHNIFAPKRPPRRASFSSLIEQHKSPFIATSDIGQVGRGDSFDSTIVDSAYASTVRSRSLLPPPRASKERKLPPQRMQDVNKNGLDDSEYVGYTDDAPNGPSRKYVFGAEMATQTSIEYDDLIVSDDPNHSIRTVEDMLRIEDAAQANVFRTSDENLIRGIQRFRESNQKSYSERSRTSGEKTMSRPHTPSVILIEQRITRSPIHMDAALIMHPFDDTTPVESHTNSVDFEHIPYADDDVQIDTDDERIINAAIRRYQMLDSDLDIQPTEPIIEDKKEESPSYLEPVLVPRRKSTAKLLSPMNLRAPLAKSDNSLASEHESAKIAIDSILIDQPLESIVQSAEDLVEWIENAVQSTEQSVQFIGNVIQSSEYPIQSADDAVKSVPEDYIDVTEIAASYIESKEQESSEPANIGIRINTIADISPEIMQEIIEHVRETFPDQFVDQAQVEEKPLDEPHSEIEPVLKFEAKTQPEPKSLIEPKTEPRRELNAELKREQNTEPKLVPRTKPKLSLEIDRKRETKEIQHETQGDAPMRPPSPNDYTPLSDIPTSFYGVRSGVSEDQSLSMASQSHVVHKPRSRRHLRRFDNSSSEEDDHQRRPYQLLHHHQHLHHHQQRSHESSQPSIPDLSGQLIRACGYALGSSLNTAGHSLVDLIRSLTKNQGEKEKDLGLVLIILILIVACLMMLGLSGEQSVHHHHWNYINPPDNTER